VEQRQRHISSNDRRRTHTTKSRIMDHPRPPLNNGDSESLDYSTNNVDSQSESFYHHDGAASSITGPGTGLSHIASAHSDATGTVHEMYLALLYLMSNPDEFKKALTAHPKGGTTTLADWNASYSYQEDDEDSVMTTGTATTPLPYVVFADDAEVVLPQAHTASQLFGIERIEGIELEAAAGVPALSQLFLRWLALMPGADHLNLVDPPGLTVMRIAGGRYRVTAAHRVIWTWMNEFATLVEEGHTSIGAMDSFSTKNVASSSTLQVGDLVCMTIVDVFETDNQGKLLSYCPTFDNRSVFKTNQASETIRKSSRTFFSMMGRTQKAVAKSQVTRKASAHMQRFGNFAENVKHRVDEAVYNYSSPARAKNSRSQSADESETVDTDRKRSEV
jgi:hypothetical protein